MGRRLTLGDEGAACLTSLSNPRHRLTLRVTAAPAAALWVMVPWCHPV
jgi:hypothetical protein